MPEFHGTDAELFARGREGWHRWAGDIWLHEASGRGIAPASHFGPNPGWCQVTLRPGPLRLTDDRRVYMTAYGAMTAVEYQWERALRKPGPRS